MTQQDSSVRRVAYVTSRFPTVTEIRAHAQYRRRRAKDLLSVCGCVLQAHVREPGVLLAMLPVSVAMAEEVERRGYPELTRAADASRGGSRNRARGTSNGNPAS
jgi:hypothetical protein